MKLPAPATNDVIPTGLFTLGGAVIGAAGSQTRGIVKDATKSRARKRKAEQQRRYANAARWREIYSDFTANLGAAADVVNFNRQALRSIGTAQLANPAGVERRLASVRKTATQIQVDGSKEAYKIATEVIDGIRDLQQVISRREAFGK
jgi:hypothetical protein